MKHVDDLTLAALALEDVADLPPEEVAAAQAHLTECEDCRAESAALVDLLVLAGGPAERLSAPPPHVWEAVRQEVGAGTGTGTGAATSSGPTGSVVELRRRRAVPVWLASVAAASALVLGVGAGVALDGEDAPPVATPTPSPAPSVVAATQLASLDPTADDRGSAEVRRHDDRVVLHVSPRGLEGPDGIRQVWLINVDGSRMVSLGLLTPGHPGDFEFPEQLLDEGYRIVDISYEPDDGDPVHSGRSLARGTIKG